MLLFRKLCNYIKDVTDEISNLQPFSHREFSVVKLLKSLLYDNFIEIIKIQWFKDYLVQICK